MEKEIPKQNHDAKKPALSNDVLLAIQDAVALSVAGAVTEIVSSFRKAEKESQQQSQQFNQSAQPEKKFEPVKNVPPAHTGQFVSKLKGIPVEQGQDLRHVPKEVINKWFLDLESKWKDRYNARKVAGEPVSMNWTRG